ncbi:MAG: potassium channel protein [Lutimonas sp.]
MKLFKSNFIQKKIYKALLLLIVLLSVGTVGYILIGSFSFIDALYMTVITISTVGFREAQPLDLESKIFTIFLIITSVSIFGYVISVITEYISNNSLIEDIKQRKVQSKIDKLKNHTIVCGYGRNGKQAVSKLKSHKKPCVIIENRAELMEGLDIDSEVMYIKGNATDDESLIKAGIKNAAHIITTLPSDADNLYVVLSSRQLNSNITIVSRASNDSSYSKLKIAGADNVIMPDKLGGAHMASLVITPDIIEFIDRLSVAGDNVTNLVEILTDDLPKEYLSKSIYDLDLRKTTGCTVIGLKTPDREYIINPEASTKLTPNSKLILLGKPEQIRKLNQLF